VNYNEVKTINLPKIVDSEKQSVSLFAYEKDKTRVPSFMSVNQTNMIIQPTSRDDSRVYIIQIRLVDEFGT
jgi:hypothetical protein